MSPSDNHLSDIEKRKFFQRAKGLTHEQFWALFNEVCTGSYELGMKHMEEAMSCEQRISRPMMERVKKKAEEIRTEWDGLGYLTAESQIKGLVTGNPNP